MEVSTSGRIGSVRTRPALLAAVLMAVVCLVAMPQAAQAIQAFDARCLEIDNWAAGADVLTQAGALNDNPACGNTFIDWAAFGGSLPDHTISDGVGNADPDIVGPQDKLVGGSSLPKQDIYKLYASNNIEYLYFAMARRSNNGNSNWHWFITKISPTAIQGQPIIFHLQNGDTELRVCFPRGSAPEQFSAQVYQVTGLSAGQVVDVTASDIWSTVTLTPNPAALPAVALNLVDTAALPGALDDHANPTSTYETAEFAEGAIDLGELGISPCGTGAYLTVMTRSSCSLTSDLKDISGPTPYNFGDVDVTIDTPSIECTTGSGAQVTLTASASGGTGPYTFAWSEGGTPLGSGNPLIHSFSAGSHTVRVEATDSADCTGSAEVTFTVLPAVSLTLEITSSLECVSSVDLEATAGGGDGNYTYTWRVDGLIVFTDPQPSGGTSQYTLVFPDDEYCGSRTVTVEVQDSRGCTNPPPNPSKTLEKTTAINVS